MPWPMWMRRALILLLSLTLCWGTAQMAAAHVDMALQSPMVICANGAEVAVTLAPDGRAVPVTLGHHRCPDCLPATLALPPGDGGAVAHAAATRRALWRPVPVAVRLFGAPLGLPPARAPPVLI